MRLHCLCTAGIPMYKLDRQCRLLTGSRRWQRLQPTAATTHSFTTFLNTTNLGVAVGIGLRSCPGWAICYKVCMCGHTPPLLPFTITWYTFELEQLHNQVYHDDDVCY